MEQNIYIYQIRILNREVLSLLLLLSFFFCLFIHKLVDSTLVIRNEIDSSHEGLEDLGNAETFFGLIVLHNAAHGTLGSAKSGIKHVHIHFVLASLLFAKLKTDIEAAGLVVSAV